MLPEKKWFSENADLVQGVIDSSAAKICDYGQNTINL